MKLKKQLRASLFMMITVGALLFTMSIFILTQRASAKFTKNIIPTVQTSSKITFQLKIPKIHIDAPIDSVGLTSDGAMDVPKGPSGVSWFDLGPRPGDPGNAVIDGHSGYKNGIAAIFDNLYKLSVGNEITVQDNKKTITFTVSKIKRYDPSADATDVFNSSDGKSHLVLITCTGTWNPLTKSHSQRLVVVADRAL